MDGMGKSGAGHCMWMCGVCGRACGLSVRQEEGCLRWKERVPGGGEKGKDEVPKAPCATTTTAACTPAASHGLEKAHSMGTKHG